MTDNDDVSAMVALAHKIRRGGFSTVEAKATANNVITLAGRLEDREAEPSDLLDAAEAVLFQLDYLQSLWGAEAITSRLAGTLRAAVARAKGGDTNTTEDA